jgi:hypothetical protein
MEWTGLLGSQGSQRRQSLSAAQENEGRTWLQGVPVALKPAILAASLKAAGDKPHRSDYCCWSFRRSKSATSSGGNSCGASFRALSPCAIAVRIARKIAVGLTACSLVSSSGPPAIRVPAFWGQSTAASSCSATLGQTADRVHQRPKRCCCTRVLDGVLQAPEIFGASQRAGWS